MPVLKNGKYHFSDFPEFTPNLSPRDMFKMGSFGGTYWRPIKSKFYKNTLKNKHEKYPKSWWKGIPLEHLTKTFDQYDKSINKYKKKVGTTLEFWEENDWIDMMVAYSKVASGFNDDEIIRELIKRGKIVNKGIKVKNARDLNFYKMGGDMYLVDDYSDYMKLIFNERSLGIYLKETKDLVQISRGAIIKIHDFFMNKPKSL